MNQDQVKTLLLDIENSDLDFSVTFSGKESKKVNGLYKPEEKEIILHNKNFQTENQLIYTAIHEYTHHLQNEALLKATNGKGKMTSSRCHTNDFWAKFHSLLDIAEQKNLYALSLETAPELQAITEEIKKNYMATNGRLMVELGKLLIKAHQLCAEANIRYEDYIDRVLRLPRNAAKTISKISQVEISPEIGYENMKMVASIKNPEKQKEAESQLLSGHSPDSVRALMKRKAEETDERTRLEKEKQRIEKTIAQLTSRLEYIEENLAQL